MNYTVAGGFGEVVTCTAQEVLCLFVNKRLVQHLEWDSSLFDTFSCAGARGVKKFWTCLIEANHQRLLFSLKNDLKINPGDEACSESYLQSCFKNYVLFKLFVESLFSKRPVPHCTVINSTLTNSKSGVSNVGNSTGHSAGSEQISSGVFWPLWGLSGSLSKL